MGQKKGVCRGGASQENSGEEWTSCSWAKEKAQVCGTLQVATSSEQDLKMGGKEASKIDLLSYADKA